MVSGIFSQDALMGISEETKGNPMPFKYLLFQNHFACERCALE
jgi:hypothetical protein